MCRYELELDTLRRVSQILGGGMDMESLFGKAMALLRDRLGITQAWLVLKDESIDRLRIASAVGLSREEMDRGLYEIGEGVTGQVVQSGEARIIADVHRDDQYLNRIGVVASAGANDPTSFMCIPIRAGERVVGALSVHKPYSDEATLTADARLLEVVSGNIAQAYLTHELVDVRIADLRAEADELRANLRTKYTFDNIIGTSPAMMDVLATVAQVAPSRATVLLLGETGTGKELIAKAIHFNSPRRDKPFVRVNCGALSEHLLESELFGHIKGSFTGAVRDKVGRFEAADTGSIFLDEIGTLDPQLQVKLLRVLQEREFERVGDHRTFKVDTRVIAATNLDLHQEVTRGRFREDLYYRLNVVAVHLPPLRNRREDIPRLIDFFLDRYNRENDRNLKTISRELMNTLLRYPWPGNVRELENAVERAVVMSTGAELTEDLLPIQIRMFAHQGRNRGRAESIESLAIKLAEQAVGEYAGREGEIYDLVIGEIERQLIGQALRQTGGVKLRAADYLGINRNTLNKKVRELSVNADD